jgi:hypothetical protein
MKRLKLLLAMMMLACVNACFVMALALALPFLCLMYLAFAVIGISISMIGWADGVVHAHRRARMAKETGAEVGNEDLSQEQ